MRRILAIAAVFAASALSAFAGTGKTYTLNSPDGRLCTQVSVADVLEYDIRLDGAVVMDASPLSLTLTDGTVWGGSAKVRKVLRTGVDTRVASPFYRATEIRDNYNSLTLIMKGDWSVEFRAYNDGIAYRFATTAKKPFEIAAEQAEFSFGERDCRVTVPYVKRNAGNLEAQLMNSFENTYTETTLSGLDAGRLAFLPAVVHVDGEHSICFTESDLNGYPGMFLHNPDGGHRLLGHFARYPKTEVQGGHNMLQMIVTGRENYIAKVDGPRTFPWRIAVVGTDCEIAQSSLSYLLAAPSKVEDTSWIKPGKVAWDWWNDWNITGVDFRAGVNNDTYKHYIDFASEKGIEYVILDEGWAVNKKADLMQIVPEIDLPELVRYADSKGVGLILWAGYHAFERDMENVCRHYSQMGIKGFKVDFMDRDDQKMTAFNHRVAEMAARYKLIIDFHGTHKPAGINRTWPNVLNVEGVNGLEQLKWSGLDMNMVKYDTYLPFLRQVSGPMDYTQGAMLNGTRSSYRPNNSEPMSQGTRCHQLALYVVLDSPFNMLCDSPSNYRKEPECTDFIAAVPTVWDETRVLQGRMGEYVVTARRKGNTWYVGGITDWTPRDLEIDLSALGLADGIGVTLFRDGVNADRNATDYKLERSVYRSGTPLRLHLAPGGGFVACFSKKMARQ